MSAAVLCLHSRKAWTNYCASDPVTSFHSSSSHYSWWECSCRNDVAKDREWVCGGIGSYICIIWPRARLLCWALQMEDSVVPLDVPEPPPAPSPVPVLLDQFWICNSCILLKASLEIGSFLFNQRWTVLLHVIPSPTSYWETNSSAFYRCSELSFLLAAISLTYICLYLAGGGPCNSSQRVPLLAVVPFPGRYRMYQEFLVPFWRPESMELSQGSEEYSMICCIFTSGLLLLCVVCLFIYLFLMGELLYFFHVV